MQLKPAARGAVTVSVAQAVHGLPKPDQRVNAVVTPATTAAAAAAVPFAHPGVFISASQLDTIRSAVKANFLKYAAAMKYADTPYAQEVMRRHGHKFAMQFNFN